MAGIDKTSAKMHSKRQKNFVKPNFLEAFAFRTIIATKPSKATIPQAMQKGINLGYCTELSNENFITDPNKSKRHSIPRLKNAAVANIKKGRII